VLAEQPADRQCVTAPPIAPTPPPISAPVAGRPPVNAEIPAPAPAPIKPPVTALVPGSEPHPAKPSTVPINRPNIVTRIAVLHHLPHAACTASAMQNVQYSLAVSLNQDEKAAIARQSIKRSSSNPL
jgi:hypothetical protein